MKMNDKMIRMLDKAMAFINRCSNTILSKPLFRVLFCFLICILFYTAVFCMYPIQFEGNDDHGYMYIYAGYFTGKPYAFLQNMSTFLGCIVSGLYKLFPAFPCYAIFYMVVMFVSSIIVLYCVVETAYRYRTSLHICALFCILFLCVFTLRPIVLIQFTTVAAFPAAAAIALTVTFEASGKRRTITRCSLLAVLILLSHIIRSDVFTPAFIILCSIFFFKSLKNKKMAFMFLPVLMFVLAGTNLDKNITARVVNTPEWDAYNNNAMFQKVGMKGETLIAAEWLDPIEQYCISAWCFLTEYMNTDSLSNTNNTTEIKSTPEPISTSVKRAIARVKYMVAGVKYAFENNLKYAKDALLPNFQNRHSVFLYSLLLAMFVLVFFL